MLADRSSCSRLAPSCCHPSREALVFLQVEARRRRILAAEARSNLWGGRANHQPHGELVFPEHKYIISTLFLFTMAKPPNQLESVKLTITTTPHVRRYLEELVEGGFHGKNAPEAAERLLARSLETMVADGRLKASKTLKGRKRK